ncbi:1302_t:CDS:2 [Dentiscutata erythropus]|uniref:1302_t:CDS:1 n=1 Tax=Dentiscutata erythropus TaxID=1348616 RepID=A0A9N9FGG4_9GLOM|nr:1302_t:CDS:2 [Dentiscutata erythropus]
MEVFPPRAPNAIVIHRRAFIEEARKKGYNLPMTYISSAASQSWESADEIVKNEPNQIIDIEKRISELTNEETVKQAEKLISIGVHASIAEITE